MNAFRSMTLPLFALVAVLAGCSAEAGTSAGAESVDSVQAGVATEQASNTDLPEGARGHRAHGGPDFLVHAALRAPIQLSAEQRTTIEGLAKANAPREHTFDAARGAKLAAAIRSNSFEAMPKPELNESGREARVAASAKSLQTLHDTLTAEQRVALVDSLAKHAAGSEHHARHPGGPDAKAMPFLRDLDLTDAQKDALKAKFEAQRPAKPSEEQRQVMKTKFESMRADMKTKLESFKGESFDATAFVTPSKELARPEMAHRPVNGLAMVASVLTPEQRETLAARIEQGRLGKKTANTNPIVK